MCHESVYCERCLMDEQEIKTESMTLVYMAVKTGGWDGRPDFNIACGAPHFLGPAGTLMLHDPWHKNATAKPDPVSNP